MPDGAGAFTIRVIDRIAELPAAEWDACAGADGRLLGAAPLYLKGHSYGEYVFDHGWADAYERAGGRYYPKLQCAVPFTPVTGPRLLLRPGAPPEAADALIGAMVELTRRN